MAGSVARSRSFKVCFRVGASEVVISSRTVRFVGSPIVRTVAVRVPDSPGAMMRVERLV